MKKQYLQNRNINVALQRIHISFLHRKLEGSIYAVSYSDGISNMGHSPI